RPNLENAITIDSPIALRTIGRARLEHENRRGLPHPKTWRKFQAPANRAPASWIAAVPWRFCSNVRDRLKDRRSRRRLHRGRSRLGLRLRSHGSRLLESMSYSFAFLQRRLLGGPNKIDTSLARLSCVWRSFKDRLCGLTRFATRRLPGRHRFHLRGARS